MQASEAVRKTGLALSEQGYQGGRMEAAGGAWVCGRSGA